MAPGFRNPQPATRRHHCRTECRARGAIRHPLRPHAGCQPRDRDRHGAGAEMLDFMRDDIYGALTERTNGRGPNARIDAVGTKTSLRGTLLGRVRQAALLGTDCPTRRYDGGRPRPLPGVPRHGGWVRGIGAEAMSDVTVSRFLGGPRAGWRRAGGRTQPPTQPAPRRAATLMALAAVVRFTAMNIATAASLTRRHSHALGTARRTRVR